MLTKVCKAKLKAIYQLNLAPLLSNKVEAAKIFRLLETPSRQKQSILESYSFSFHEAWSHKTEHEQSQKMLVPNVTCNDA